MKDPIGEASSTPTTIAGSDGEGLDWLDIAFPIGSGHDPAGTTAPLRPRHQRLFSCPDADLRLPEHLAPVDPRPLPAESAGADDGGYLSRVSSYAALAELVDPIADGARGADPAGVHDACDHLAPVHHRPVAEGDAAGYLSHVSSYAALAELAADEAGSATSSEESDGRADASDDACKVAAVDPRLARPVDAAACDDVSARRRVRGAIYGVITEGLWGETTDASRHSETTGGHPLSLLRY